MTRAGLARYLTFHVELILLQVLCIKQVVIVMLYFLMQQLKLMLELKGGWKFKCTVDGMQGNR